MEAELVAVLKRDPPVLDGRLHPVVLPQKPTLPALTYQRVATAPVRSLSGTSDRASVVLQIDIWARSYPAAKQAADAVTERLQNSRGGDANAPVIFRHAGEQDGFEEQPDWWRITQTWRVGCPH